jgi:hypothetical protein
MENQVSIILNGVRYDAVEGLYCSECVFDKDCNSHCANLCYLLGVSNCGFKKSDKKFEV